MCFQTLAPTMLSCRKPEPEHTISKLQKQFCSKLPRTVKHSVMEEHYGPLEHGKLAKPFSQRGTKASRAFELDTAGLS